jgi:hypothetical protein
MPDFMRRSQWEVIDLAEAAELEKRYCTDGRNAEPSTYVVAVERA